MKNDDSTIRFIKTRGLGRLSAKINQALEEAGTEFLDDDGLRLKK